jgi:hypothetical protein
LWAQALQLLLDQLPQITGNNRCSLFYLLLLNPLPSGGGNPPFQG